MNEHFDLHCRWAEADNGNPMPDDIASQSIKVIRKAVAWREKGITVVVTKEPRHVAADDSNSMADWDRQDDKNGNAYGS